MMLKDETKKKAKKITRVNAFNLQNYRGYETEITQ